MSWTTDDDGSQHRIDNIVDDKYVLAARVARSDMDPSWCGFVILYYRTSTNGIASSQVGFIDEDTLEGAQAKYENYYLPLVLDDPYSALIGGPFQ